MKFNRASIAITVILLVTGMFFLMRFSARERAQTDDKVQDNLHQRVLRSGKIRCGYVVYPPACIKDPNTGKLSGIFVEALEQAAKNLGLAVVWSEELGWGSMIEGLEANRYDIVGSASWTNSARGKVVDFSIPLFYSGICVYTRPHDKRFIDNLEAINSPDIKIATIDGETADFIARTRFARAKRVSLPQLADVSQMLLNVSQGKADVAFIEPYIGYQFLQHNPNSVKNITPKEPVVTFGNAMIFKKGEGDFKSMLDTALSELLNSGQIDKLIDKYEPTPGTFYRIAYPYRADGNQKNADILNRRAVATAK